MLDTLGRADRLRLMKFICSFAWADLQVRDEERSFVTRLVTRLDLDQGEQAQVSGWLETPPPPEEVDPTTIPLEHRKLFVETVEQILLADDELAPEERESFQLFRQLLAS